jgi:hypothetical protein
MSPLVQVLIPVTTLALLVLVIALCRSAARADASMPRDREAVTRTSEVSSASVRRQSPQPSTSERRPPLPLAQAHLSPPVWLSRLDGRLVCGPPALPSETTPSDPPLLDF